METPLVKRIKNTSIPNSSPFPEAGVMSDANPRKATRKASIAAAITVMIARPIDANTAVIASPIKTKNAKIVAPIDIKTTFIFSL